MDEPILNLKTIFDYVSEYYPNLLFWDGYSKHEVRNPSKAYKHRQGMPNEIRIEFDSKDNNKNWENINDTAINLYEKGYNFAIYYVEGGRSPHLHLYDIDELDNYSIEFREAYRKKFILKHCPKGSEPDLGLCDEKHLCALEFANHFKYNKPKRLLFAFFQGSLNNQGLDNQIFLDIVFKKKEKKAKKLINKKRLKLGEQLYLSKTELIYQSLSFESVFEKYGIKYKGKMALCPFHIDTNYSLSFSNEKSVWKCWGTGCEKKGDIITLIKLLEEKKGDNKKRS